MTEVATPSRRRTLRFSLRAALLVVTFAACVLGLLTARWRERERVLGLIRALPSPYSQYRPEPYQRAAAALQNVWLNEPGQLLLEAGKLEYGNETIVLARMLFVARPGSKFRRPGIGGASFWGGTGYENWPLEPIELVEGVPFMITDGYMLGGVAETDEMYVTDCLENCDWSSHRYRVASADELQAALAKLLASPKWKRALRPREVTLLGLQIGASDEP